MNMLFLQTIGGYMDIREVGRRVYISLCNANSRNQGREIFVSLDDLVRDVQSGASVEISREQIVDAIENDPFRQVNAYGVITNIPLFDTGRTNGVLTSVQLPKLAYENPEQWGLD
ncbi:hypothetical protein [Kluyvera ascorbata]|uniref:hypothetical protein n=1 Tax=Kluyvera ascorbata TaxID=51288 RepID=UPI003510B95D